MANNAMLNSCVLHGAFSTYQNECPACRDEKATHAQAIAQAEREAIAAAKAFMTARMDFDMCADERILIVHDLENAVRRLTELEIGREIAREGHKETHMQNNARLTVEEIEAIQARAEAATPGEWEWEGNYFRGGKPYNFQVRQILLGSEVHPRVFLKTQEGWEPSEQDADFITHAHQDIPNLCATAKAALKDRDEAVEALEQVKRTWVKWLVEEAGFPYEVQYKLNPPCSPMEVATAWQAMEDASDLYPEDYLTTMEMELGKEYMTIWEFNSNALLARIRAEEVQGG